MSQYYDIFISYRRDGGFETAKHLNDLLVRDGYTVSFDIDTLREGDFDDTLLQRIDQCIDFILVVDKHTFDRTLDPDFNPKYDWLRTELAYALKQKKNIIPVLLSGVEGFPENLPADIMNVSTKNGPQYNKYYFDEFYRRLKTFLHSLPRNAEADKRNYATLTISSDADAFLFSDGEHIAGVKAGKFTKVKVPLGEHVFDYVSYSDPSRRYSEVHAFNEAKNYVIQIKLNKRHGSAKSSSLMKMGLILAGVVAAIVALFSIGNYKSSGAWGPQAEADSIEAQTSDENGVTTISPERLRAVGMTDDFTDVACYCWLTEEMVTQLSKPQLRLLRNTIFAHHGRIFKSEDLSEYFSQFSWYYPRREEVDLNELSRIERHNISIIQAYE